MIGGIVSELNGGSFSNGAIIAAASAAMSIGLNELGKNSQGIDRQGTVGEGAERRAQADLEVSQAEKATNAIKPDPVKSPTRYKVYIEFVDAVISADNSSFLDRFIGDLKMDYYRFTQPSLPNDRIDVFMKYYGTAVLTAAGGASAYSSGLRIFASGGGQWHLGLELVGGRNLIHIGNSIQHGVHIAIGYVAPYVAWFHQYIYPKVRMWWPGRY